MIFLRPLFIFCICSILCNKISSQVVAQTWAALTTSGGPQKIAIDATGNLYIVNSNISTVSKITASGTVTKSWATLASNTVPVDIVIDGSNNVYTCNFSGVSKIAANGTLTQAWANLTNSGYAYGIAIDASGNLYRANYGVGTVSKITASGTVTPAFASIEYGIHADPWGIVTDNSGNVYTANYGLSSVSKITASGTITQEWGSFAFAGTAPRGIAIDASGNIYTANWGNNTVTKITASGNATITWATLATGAQPWGIAVDGSGNVYTANNGNNTVSKITAAGTVTQTWATLASDAGPRGIAIDASGNLYTANNSNATVSRILVNTVWTGSINTDWATAGNWNTNTVPTNQLNAIIPATVNQPIISASTTAAANNITLQNAAVLNIAAGGTLTASGTITVNPGGSITGNYAGITGTTTLQQSIIAQRGWRMFANPFSTTQTFASLSSTNNVTINTSAGPSGIADTRVFNNSVNAWADAGTSTAANTAYGLFIRGIKSDISGGGTGLTYTAGPTAFTYGVSGALNGNSVTIPSSNSSNFSLVGNPYAAPINSQALTGGTAQSYYLYQIAVSGNGQTKAGSWSSVLTSDNATPIPVLGVIALQTAGNYSVSTSDINTTNTAASGLFGIDTPIPHIELQVEQNGNYQDNMFVRLDPAATAKGTDKIDLEKFYNDNVNVYSITTADNTRLAVDARNVLNTIPLGISGLAGDYNFKLSSNNLPDGTTVYLKDNFLQTNTALKVGDVYPFSITTDAASYGEQRFELLFSTKSITIANDPSGSLTAHVLGNITSGNLIAVQIGGATTPVTINIKDMNGKALRTINAVNGIQYVNVGNTAKGMLLLQISDGKSSIIKKVMKL